MNTVITAWFVVAAALSLVSWRRNKRQQGISRIRGPSHDSVLLGNFVQYFQGGVGEYEFRWQAMYGAVYRFTGLFMEQRLMVADPKALQHIYQGSGTHYLKPTIRREFGRMYLGRGIAWAEGDDHKRHRKIMTPAFRNVESRSMIPIFHESAARLCQQWRDVITQESGKTLKIDVTNWLSRATLDALGEVAFNYRFGALENKENKLAQCYRSLLVNTFGLPTRTKIFVQQMLIYLPMPLFRVLEALPSRSLQGLRNVAIEGNKVAKELVGQKMEEQRHGADKTGKDVLSLLVQANIAEKQEDKLSEEELLSQMRTVMVAGHETTGNSISFLLFELSKRPEVQEKVRAEIKRTQQQIHARGDSQFGASDYDRMVYTTAVIKETLRFHPVVYGPFLQPAHDDVLPLSKPIRDIDGKMIFGVPVNKGVYIHISISGYNRLPDVWGPDAHEFVPERWLDGADWKINSPFGVYSNLGNFVSGAQSCLGWRFAIYEIHAFLIEIMLSFRLSYPDGAADIIRATSGVMAPVLSGEEENGKQLPLDVAIVD